MANTLIGFGILIAFVFTGWVLSDCEYEPDIPPKTPRKRVETPRMWYRDHSSRARRSRQ